MEFDYGKAQEKWQERCEEFEKFQEKPLSETDGRCKIIDPLLKEVFGWEEDFISREPKIEAGFIDYYCATDSNKYVLEAKSTKIEFKMRTSNKVQVLKSKNLKKTAEALYEAIEQAREYARQKETTYFVVSNGLNILICKTFRSGAEEADCIAIFGRECITKNFHILYEILSPYKMGAEFFFKYLKSNNEIRSKPNHTKTLLQTLYDPSTRKGDNPLAAPLMPYLNKYFTDITDDEELIKNLYCDNTNLDSYGQEMKRYLKGRIPMLGLPVETVKQIETNDDSLGSLGLDMVMRMQDSEASSYGHVFVLFGNLGAGKSTFLNRFYAHVLKPVYKKKLIWVQVDFQAWYGAEEEIEEFITTKIEEELYKRVSNLDEYDTLKLIYEKEITRKTKGPWKPLLAKNHLIEEKIGTFLEEQIENKKNHVEKMIDYLKQKEGFEVCLVFDNLDQQSAGIQEQATFYALSNSKKLKILAILSLRDETYWSIKKKPPMNAYGNITPYQIVPPSIEKVLLKRIDYVIESVGKKEITFDSSPNTQYNKVIKINFSELFNLFKDTINTEYSVSFFNNLAGGNLRYGLALFKDIVTSGHVDLNNILSYNFLEKGEKKLIPYDKLIKTVGLSNQAYYDSYKSNLLNLYQVNYNDGFYSHFINFRILEILKGQQESTHSLDVPKGYVPIGNLLEDLKLYCTNEAALRSIIGTMVERYILESDIGARKLGEDNYIEKIKYVRITPAGIYFIDELIFNHQYLELVLFDTSIQKKQVFEKIKENLFEINCQKKQSRKDYHRMWELRFDNVTNFLNYLKEKEEEDLDLLKKAGYNHFGKIIPEVINKYNLNKEFIRSRLEKKVKSKV